MRISIFLTTTAQRIIKNFFVLVVSLFSCSLFYSYALSPLKASHDWIMNNKGQVVILHGVNLVIKSGKSAAEAGFDIGHAKLLQQHGLNVVRLGLLWNSIEPTPNPNNKLVSYQIM